MARGYFKSRNQRNYIDQAEKVNLESNTMQILFHKNYLLAIYMQ